MHENLVLQTTSDWKNVKRSLEFQESHKEIVVIDSSNFIYRTNTRNFTKKKKGPYPFFHFHINLFEISLSIILFIVSHSMPYFIDRIH